MIQVSTAVPRPTFAEITDVSSVDSGHPDTPDTDESSDAALQSSQKKVTQKPPLKESIQQSFRQPCQGDFETIKLVSNGAYG